MADRKDITEMFAMIVNVFLRFELKRGTIDDYFNLLKDLPSETLKAASKECVTSSPFPPSVYELRKTAVNLHKRADNVPSAAEAWEEVLSAPEDGIERRVITEGGSYVIEVFNYVFTHPLVEKVARNMGWPKKFWTSSLMADRSRFMNAYEANLDRSSAEARSVPAVMKYIERTGRSDVKEIASAFRSEALERGD